MSTLLDRSHGPIALSGQAQILAQAAELMRESVIITTAGENGRGHRILFANSAYAAMTGWSREEVLGRSPSVLAGPATDAAVLDRLRADLLAGRNFEGRAINYKKDGTPFELDWYIRAIRDESGTVTHYFAVQRDISRATEEQNRQEGLRQAFEQMLDTVVIFSTSGRVVMTNQALLQWLGEATEPTVESYWGRPVWQLPGRPSRSLDFQFARRQLAAGKPWQREYTTRRGPLGSLGPRVVQTSISPVRHDGKLVGFVAVARDVTERARLEQIAASVNLTKNLGLLFSGIRHELGNPVNSLKSALTVVRSNTIDTERREHYLGAMAQQIERIEYLLDNLRSFGLFDQMSIESVDLRDLFCRLGGLVRPDLEANGVRLEIRSTPRLFVRGSHQALLHVFLNLISNAAAALAGSRDGLIRLTASTVRKRIHIAVEDNGTGIPAADLGRIFAPFFTSRPQGTGLGLAIVRKLVSEMGGTIDVDSRLGRGTTFTLILDRALAA